MAEYVPGAVLDPSCPVEWSNPLNRGLVGCWAVPPNAGWRGGRTLRDLVRGGKMPSDGTLTNMAFPATSTSGWSGPRGRPGGFGSLRFDGSNDRVNVANDGRFSFTGTAPFSAAFWVCRAGGSGFERIISAQSTSTTGWYVGWDGSFCPYIMRENTGYSPTTTTCPSGTWCHVLFTYDGSGYKCFQNGVQTKSVSNTTSMSAGNSTIAFGGRAEVSPGAGQDLPAYLDDLRIWSRPLSAGESAALYDQSRRGHPDTMRWLTSRAFFGPQAAGGAFQPAWAAASNVIVGGAF